MKIRELFVHDVTRNIPPVVYFHEQSPERLAAEVSEYIITGGYPPDDPRHRRVPEGIHEAYVKLLTRMRAALERAGGAELPAVWVSGSYGSGKSSFAKVFGLAFGGAFLPDGTPLATALLRRDDSPLAEEFSRAWHDLAAKVKVRSVVFDIGSVARDNEQIHVAALRQVQAALGYCPHKERVAAYELILETDGRWGAFLEAAQKALGRPWSEAMLDAAAEDHFSHCLHVLEPERYRDPMSWLDVHQGRKSDAGTSVAEVCGAIERMLRHRAPDATLFLVIDEVSQYIHQDEGRMLALQGLVSELGQRLRGRAWVIATGQQKLEEQADGNVLSKLKDRFPAPLRVHLTNSNIRDVVHKRLLQKRPDREGALRELFQAHRADLTVHALDGHGISDLEFVEAYPMLPWHVDVLLQVTSALRLRSSRAQADDQTLRGLLQLLGELFRERGLADRELGELITFDEIFEVQRTALDEDLQDSLANIRRHEVCAKNPFAWRVARAVALLQQIQDQTPTTEAFVARALYTRVGQGAQLAAVREALDQLRAADLVAYSEKEGYAIQSTAGMEWQRDRDEYGPDTATLAGLVRDALKTLLALPDRPRLKGRPLAWSAWFSDEATLKDEHIVAARAQDAAAPLDLRFLWSKELRSHDRWAAESARGEAQDRVVWVAGDVGRVESVAREFARSAKMVERYAARRQSLPRDRQMLLLAEETRREELEKKLSNAVGDAFLDGGLWFRGRLVRPRDKGAAFGPIALAFVEETLPALYPSFTDIAVLPKELEQLLAKDLSGPSPKFLAGGLRILSLDAGRYVPECDGPIPTAVLQYLEAHGGIQGGDLLGHFAKPPFGWPADVVKACLAGLLRAGKLRVQTTGDARITSVLDVGVKDLFDKDRDLRNALYYAHKGPITGRDRVAICKLFDERLNAAVNREDDAIADAVWKHFPLQRAKLREVEQRLGRLGLGLPTPLAALGRALEGCVARQVEQCVVAVKDSLEALRDGLDALNVLHHALTDAAVTQVLEARDVTGGELAQLEAASHGDAVAAHAATLRAQLAHPTPWVGIGDARAPIDAIRARYREARKGVLDGLSARVEQARKGMHAHPNFARLTPDQRHKVLRPFQSVLHETTDTALSPGLDELRERFPERLRRAEEAALQALDEALDDAENIKVAVLDADLRGKEFGSEEELDGFLADLRERVVAQLRAGHRVRIR
ncbi:MAG: BREX system P-loop protein BrxC [Polyangiales bacterium]